ncbi:hypothetical protein Bca101_002392 [Brassica carinata]
MEASPSKVLVSLGPFTNLLAFLLTPGLRVGLRVYAGDSPGRMSPIFKSAVLAKYYGEKKRPQKVKKKRENTDEVQRFGRGTGVATSDFELVMWKLRWLHQEGKKARTHKDKTQVLFGENS